MQGDEIPSSCPGHVVKDMLGSLDPGWIISLCEAILLRRIAILPKVVLVLIIAKCLEDALHGFIADGLLGLFVGGLPGHADSHSFSLTIFLMPSGAVVCAPHMEFLPQLDGTANLRHV